MKLRSFFDALVTFRLDNVAERVDANEIGLQAAEADIAQNSGDIAAMGAQQFYTAIQETAPDILGAQLLDPAEPNASGSTWHRLVESVIDYITPPLGTPYWQWTSGTQLFYLSPSLIQAAALVNGESYFFYCDFPDNAALAGYHGKAVSGLFNSALGAFVITTEEMPQSGVPVDAGATPWESTDAIYLVDGNAKFFFTGSTTWNPESTTKPYPNGLLAYINGHFSRLAMGYGYKAVPSYLLGPVDPSWIGTLGYTAGSITIPNQLTIYEWPVGAYVDFIAYAVTSFTADSHNSISRNPLSIGTPVPYATVVDIEPNSLYRLMRTRVDGWSLFKLLGDLQSGASVISASMDLSASQFNTVATVDAAATLTIPTGAVETSLAGLQTMAATEFIRDTTNAVTVAAASGVLLNGVDGGSHTISHNHGHVTLRKIDLDSYLLYGDVI